MVRELRARTRTGFTLVELLVVITIIGILIALLLPAVQAAREAARRTTCVNNLKQVATAWQSHETKWGHFPSGGWGWNWTGDADMGHGRNQPGSWTYSLLPFIDQQNLYDLDGGPSLNATQKKTLRTERIQTPVATLLCPTRRTVQVYRSPYGYRNANYSEFVSKSDFAANSGSQSRNENFGGPGNMNEGLNRDYWSGAVGGCPGHALQPTVDSVSTGVCYQRSEIGHTHIRKGAAQTYMVGEKYINRDHYITGRDAADNESAYTGYNNDLHRGGHIRPYQDRRGVSNTKSFGSAHPGGFHMAFCDGHVEAVSYGIDLAVHRRLANRLDLTPISDEDY